MFSISTVILMALTGLICFAIPVICAVIFKMKVKTAPVSAVFVGAGTFFIFALLLEQILHAIMLPIVSKSDLLYIIYGALAAGIFEETGRFLAFKTVLKKKTAPETSVMYGIGHGRCEAIMILGMTMVSGIVIAVLTNLMGIDGMIKLSAAGKPELEETARLQIETLAAFGAVNMILSLFERLMAIVLHVSLSVLVFEGARVKGKTWLYPACILIHAVFDVPSAMYQRGLLGIATVYVITAAMVPAAALLAAREYGRMRKMEEN